jgi:phosphomannomutase
LLAIETSGHSAWRDNNYVDDGCYTAARLLGRLARERRLAASAPSVGTNVGTPPLGLVDLLGNSLAEPLESIKVKMAVAGGLSAVAEAEAALCDALRRCAEGTDGWQLEAVNHDGLRCAVGAHGWLIIRGSLHEPSVSVQTESDDLGGTAAICATLLAYAERGECEARGIDLAPMRHTAAAVAT